MNPTAQITLHFVPASLAEFREAVSILRGANIAPAAVTVAPPAAAPMSAPAALPVRQASAPAPLPVAPAPRQASAPPAASRTAKKKHPLELHFNFLYRKKFTVSDADCLAVDYTGDKGAVDRETRLSMIATRLVNGGVDRDGAEVAGMPEEQVQAMIDNAGDASGYADGDGDAGGVDPDAPAPPESIARMGDFDPEEV